MNKPVEFSWGEELEIETNSSYVMKKFLVKRRGATPTWCCRERMKTWYVAKGTGWGQVDDRKFFMKEGHYIHIPAGTTHKISASHSDMIIIETSAPKIEDAKGPATRRK